MSKIIDLINSANASEGPDRSHFVSFEFYPPKTADGVQNLYRRLERMKNQNPLFIDFTWGAGGSTSDLTVELSTKSAQEFGYEVNMHLTCTNMDLQKIIDGLSAAKSAGIRNICALRGDPPEGQERWTAGASGFECARDLIDYIRKEHGDYFGIQVAGYPEGHPDKIKEVGERKLSPTEESRLVQLEVDGKLVPHVCSDKDYWSDIDYLKTKVDAGGDVIISQLFYDADQFMQWVKDCRSKGITCPILPGIMPILKYDGFKRFIKFCKTRIPESLYTDIESHKGDAASFRAFGVSYCVSMCRRLLDDGGISGLHFYTMNLEKATMEILEALGLKLAVSEL
eukprot:107051_1